MLSALTLMVVAALLADTARAQTCEERLASANANSFRAKCEACQRPRSGDPNNDSPCEYCAGMCFHGALGGPSLRAVRPPKTIFFFLLSFSRFFFLSFFFLL